MKKKYFDVNNIYGWGMEQNLPVGGFKWVKDVSRIDEDFIKKTMKKIVISAIFLK